MDKLPVLISVTPTTGKGRGKKLGIPTLNFLIPPGLTIPYGVYAGWLKTAGRKYKSAIHFGPRPQFAEKDPSLEVFLLDGFISPQLSEVKLEFTNYIRPVISFPSVETMLTQIKQDVRDIENCLYN